MSCFERMSSYFEVVCRCLPPNRCVLSMKARTAVSFDDVSCIFKLLIGYKLKNLFILIHLFKKVLQTCVQESLSPQCEIMNSL